MSSRCRPTPGSFSSGWRSRTSMSSKASARRSRFGRRTASATRGRRSARRPRSTTTCACSSPASAAPSAAAAAARSSARRPRWWRRGSATLPEGTRLLIGFDMPVVTTATAPSLEGAEGRDEQDGRRRTPKRRQRRGRGATGPARTGGSGGRDARRAAAQGVRPPLRRWADALARGGGSGRPAGPPDAAGDRRSRQGRRRSAGAADRFDRDGLHRGRRRRVCD